MSGNSFGKILKVTTFGESHGKAMGVVIDGMPPNLEIFEDALQTTLDKRRPGRLSVSTARDEKDIAVILSGVFEGKTLGSPISVIIKNTDQKSSDYDKLQASYRPGHADQTTIEKFGIRDHRGGGRSSGRETVSRVVAGYFASLIIPKVSIKSVISHIGEHPLSVNFDSNSSYGLGDASKDQEIKEYLERLKLSGESAGGKVEVTVSNMPKGLGDPCFDKLKATLAHGLMSIGSCMGVTFGLGDQFKSALGSQISQNKSYFGGIEGGISNGEDLQISLVFKAPSTVGNKAKEGRHDPCILPRVIPVINAMVSIVIADHKLVQRTITEKEVF